MERVLQGDKSKGSIACLVCTTVLILFGQSRSVSAARGHRVIMAARMGTQNQASANDNSGSSPGNLPSQARPRLMTGQLHRDASSSNNKAEFDPSRSVAAWSSAANGFNNNRYSLASAVSRLQNTNYAPVGNAAVRSAVNRPIVQVAEPEDPLLVRPIFNRVSRITENDLGGDPTKSASDGLLLSGYGNNIGGYMLGRIMLNRLRVDGPCCERCNCSSRVGESIEGDSYLAAYIPFRYRFRGKNDSTQTADIATTSTTAMPLKSDDSPPSLLCALQRWNRELPFTELPNMLLSFISDDEHSGKEYSEKASFISKFLNQAVNAYGKADNKSDVFFISKKYGQLSQCAINGSYDVPATESTTAATVSSKSATISTSTKAPWNAKAIAQWTEMVKSGDLTICGASGIPNIPGCDAAAAMSKNVDPFYTGIKQLERFYSSNSHTAQMEKDLVRAARNCYPADAAVSTPESIIPCLDFSMGSGEALNLTTPASLFCNDEVCQRILAPDIPKCMSQENYTFTCTSLDLIVLNIFARNYYLCPEPVDQSLLLQVIKNTILPTATPDLDFSFRTSSASSLLQHQREPYVAQDLIQTSHILVILYFCLLLCT